MKKYILLIISTSQPALAQLDMSFGISFSRPALETTAQPIPLRSDFKAQMKRYSQFKVPRLPSPLLVQTDRIARLLSPALQKIPDFKISHLQPQNINLPIPSPAPLVPRPQIEQLDLQIEPPDIKTVHEIHPDEYKLLLALIFSEIHKKKLPAVILVADLLQSSRYKSQAAALYAEMALSLGLKQEFKFYLLQYIRDFTSEAQKSALDMIMKNAEILDIQDIKNIESLVRLHHISPSAWYLYRKAQYLEQNGQVLDALSLLRGISRTADSFIQSQLFAANLLYRSGQLNEATQTLQRIEEDVPKERQDRLRNLYYLTSARLYFQKSQYEASYKMYLQIDKSSPLWLQASTEQALAQTLNGDYVGAAGNMFSLHTEYFKNAFSPQSYVIRAVGYLNLCQYGDAITAVADLERRYNPVLSQLESFRQTNRTPDHYYKLVQQTLNNPKTESALPRSFIYEIAQAPRFLSHQRQLNKVEDELAVFNRLSKEVPAARSLLQNQMQQLQVDRSARRSHRQLALETEIDILRQGESRLSGLRIQNKDRLAQLKNTYRPLAALTLQQQFDRRHDELKEVLAQKDILAYEIYSGAGEHLRAQSAGAEIGRRKPASELKPEEQKSYQWKYRGELWEDEIGHYRSSLTNVCAQNQ